MMPSDFKVAVSKTALGKQIGNAMSIHVIERLLVKRLPAAGFVMRGPSGGQMRS